MQLRRLGQSAAGFLRTVWDDEDGNISIMMAVLLPAFLWLMAYFETEMQAKYIYNQTQFVMDMATRAGAATGEAVATQNATFCTIPYRPADTDNSGYHTAIKVLKDNASTLPAQIRDQLVDAADNRRIEDLNDTDLRASGVVEMKMTLYYTPKTPLFFSDYRFNVESTSRCQAVRKSNPSPGGGGGGCTTWAGPVLNAAIGTVQGPSGKETYYNLPMGGVVSIMRGMGNNDAYWVRADGVKMLGNYIMVAADLSIRPRGSIVETSLGPGIVCDTGTFIYSNPYQLDIAVEW